MTISRKDVQALSDGPERSEVPLPDAEADRIAAVLNLNGTKAGGRVHGPGDRVRRPGRV